MQRARVGLEVEDVGGPGFEVRTRAKSPAPTAVGRLDQRLERVGADQRVHGRRVGPQAVDLSPRSLDRAEQRLAIGGALTGTSPRLPSATTSRPASRGAATTWLSAAQPGAPRRSKQASWGLTATQYGAVASISVAAVGGDRLGRGLGGLDARPRLRLEPGRIRVESEADLAAALCDERREPVGERCCQGVPSRP